MALAIHLKCVIGQHDTDGVYPIVGVGGVCVSHWEALIKFFRAQFFPTEQESA